MNTDTTTPLTLDDIEGLKGASVQIKHDCTDLMSGELHMWAGQHGTLVGVTPLGGITIAVGRREKIFDLKDFTVTAAPGAAPADPVKPEATPDKGHVPELVNVPPLQAINSPTNPRRRRGLDLDSLRTLADSITAHGLGNPILVRPLRWNAEAERLGVRYRVFCASLADVFDNEVPQLWRTSLFGLIHDTPYLDWLLLTKRIGNASEMLKSDPPEGIDMCALPNVWIGATICNQKEADRDIPKLLQVPAAKRFLSMEPLLGPVDLNRIHESGMMEGGGSWDSWESCLTGRRFDIWSDGETTGWPKVDWVIVGGESGPGARPMHPDWARNLRDQCQAAGVPFLFKQWGEWALQNSDPSKYPMGVAPDGSPVGPNDHFTEDCALMYRVGKKTAGRLLDGWEWNEVPA